MIDSLIGESNLPKGLKEQKDGKIIDHIYRDHSLIDTDDDIYFIGDSKYYKEENEIGANSIYKQFTYAKNVIQYNMDVFNGVSKDDPDEKLSYLDKNTEGYNITPNFFIRGHIEKDKLNDYSSNGLRPAEKERISYHFENRLFDRDTLILQTYNINFLFVLAAYVQGAGEHTKEIRRVFRENVKEVLQRRYQFYALKPRIQGEAEGYLKEHFQDVLGKVYAPYDAAQTNCLSLALDNAAKYDEGNERLRSELEQHFFIHEIANGNIDGNPETLFGEDEQTKYAAAANNEKSVLTGLVRKSDADYNDFVSHKAVSYVMERIPINIDLSAIRYFLPMVGGAIDGYYKVDKVSFGTSKGNPCLKLKLSSYTNLGADLILIYRSKMQPGEMISLEDVIRLYR